MCICKYHMGKLHLKSQMPIQRRQTDCCGPIANIRKNGFSTFFLFTKEMTGLEPGVCKKDGTFGCRMILVCRRLFVIHETHITSF